MRPVRNAVGVLVLAGLFTGCGGEGGNTVKPEEKAADYGQMSGDKMKSMIGVPSAKSVTDQQKEAAKK